MWALEDGKDNLIVKIEEMKHAHLDNKLFFIIFKSLIPYNFHNPCHQCQYQTNTTLKREREKLNLTEDK